jgi:hypothetical protein
MRLVGMFVEAFGGVQTTCKSSLEICTLWSTITLLCGVSGRLSLIDNDPDLDPSPI